MMVMKSWGMVSPLMRSIMACFRASILVTTSFPSSASLISLANAGVPLSKWTSKVHDFSIFGSWISDLEQLEREGIGISSYRNRKELGLNFGNSQFSGIGI